MVLSSITFETASSYEWITGRNFILPVLLDSVWKEITEKWDPQNADYFTGKKYLSCLDHSEDGLKLAARRLAHDIEEWIKRGFTYFLDTSSPKIHEVNHSLTQIAGERNAPLLRTSGRKGEVPQEETLDQEEYDNPDSLPRILPCGHPLLSMARFCPICGQPVVDPTEDYQALG